MKPLLFLFAAFLLAGPLMAQQRWTVSYQKKIRLKSVEENVDANIIGIKRTTLSASGDLIITFKVNDGTVHRTVMADDSTRSGITSWEKVKKTLVIKGADLRKLFKDREKSSLLRYRNTQRPGKSGCGSVCGRFTCLR